MDGEPESAEETGIQSDQIEAAFDEFEQQLANERAQLEYLTARVAELEQSGTAEPDRDGIDGTGSELAPGTEGSPGQETDGSVERSTDEPVTVELTSIDETITELPPRSTHPLFRRIWGRDVDGEVPGEHWIHRPIRG